jgi:hypothetical protein
VGVGLDLIGRDAWAARRRVWGLVLGAVGAGAAARWESVELNGRLGVNAARDMGIRGAGVLLTECELLRKAERASRVAFMVVKVKFQKFTFSKLKLPRTNVSPGLRQNRIT